MGSMFAAVIQGGVLGPPQDTSALAVAAMPAALRSFVRPSGTSARDTELSRSRALWPWYEAKKNRLSFKIGPPIVAPKVLRLRVGTF
jgi:hypothetical protein